MFCAWRYGGEHPWRLYNRLDVDYRPVWDPGLPAVRPRYPDRLRWFMYACGKVAAIIEGVMKDERPAVTQRRPIREREEKQVLGPDGTPYRDSR